MKPFWITNLILFQASWFSAAFLTSYATLIITVLLIIHFALSPNAKDDFKVLPLVILGLFVDNLHFSIGTFTTPDPFFPNWLVLLWVMFIISLNYSLHWLINKPLLVLVAFGAIGGTLSYWGGIKTGALEINWTNSSVIFTLAIAWGILFPLLVVSYRYIQQTLVSQISR
ncbi:DUF2878 domain-containing protein [Vibrio sinensis]|uniref:DUF2878 domain-containing protein n=1 Tax=Vibrio sinensis TaxID=2302434 RepID=A0A3A6R9B1_9VIBR|nr:DUF2878 domain-containing protein [Vibrio sinensis]RJX73682.1 DUF2878 domain-containing protein [Vibrio sinensis]